MRFSISWISLLVVIFFSISFVLNYQIISKKMIFIRSIYIKSCQELINALSSTVIIDQHSFFFLPKNKSRQKLIQKGVITSLEAWFEQKFKMLYWRFISAILGQLTVSGSIILLLVAFCVFPIETSIKCIIFGSLLSVGQEFFRFFAAFSGYAAQLPSELNLNFYSQLQRLYPDPCSFNAHHIEIRSFKVQSLNMITQPLVVPFDVMKLDGNSGQGKTSLMKSLAKLSSPLSTAKVAYISYQGFKQLDLIKVSNLEMGDPHTHLNHLSEKGFKVFLLDETFLDYSLEWVFNFFSQLTLWCQKMQTTIIFVDHRLKWAHTLRLLDWVSPLE